MRVLTAAEAEKGVMPVDRPLSLRKRPQLCSVTTMGLGSASSSENIRALIYWYPCYLNCACCERTRS